MQSILAIGYCILLTNYFVCLLIATGKCRLADYMDIMEMQGLIDNTSDTDILSDSEIIPCKKIL